jgi:hypothetical protein
MLKIIVSVLIGTSLTIGTGAFAQAPLRHFPVQGTKAFNECLFAAWVDDYCRGHIHWFARSYDEFYRACVIANGGGRFPMDGRTGFNTEDYCRARAHIH